MKNKIVLGHIMTFIAVFVWSITFVSSKILLKVLTPVEILFYRFLMAYVVLLLIYPKFKKIRSVREELIYLGLGLTGVSLYFLAENTALIYTYATNVGLLISAVPIFTAIVAHFFTHDEKFHKNLLIGFFAAMVGIALVIFNGQMNLKINPLGDMLALVAAIIWAFYSVLLKKIDPTDHPIFVVRKTFFYGLLSILPMLYVLNGGFQFGKGIDAGVMGHLLFLGIGASAICYVFWNNAVAMIGAVKASNYIYLMPLITMVTSIIVLKEKVNGLMIMGCVFIVIGVYISERGLVFWKKEKKNEEDIKIVT